jgi:hypothetical protein
MKNITHKKNRPLILYIWLQNFAHCNMDIKHQFVTGYAA